MTTHPPQLGGVTVGPVPAGSPADPRWLLVERIIASEAFAGSARLSSFLRCVCDLTRRGEYDRINEQTIGALVFGRKPDYDPGVDSIVRSHASRLRHRLDLYFAGEGAAEEWVLSIPKGAYVPVFKLRREVAEPVFEVEEAARVTAAEPHTPSATIMGPTAKANAGVRKQPARLLAGALTVSLVLLAVAAGWIVRLRHRPAVPEPGATIQLFWSRLFTAEQPTLVVSADSGLVMLQGITKRRVGLPMYIDGTYLNTVRPEMPLAAEALNLARRRYTSVVDLTITHKILRMGGLDLQNTRFVYARDIRPRDMKQGNFVLLGTYESTPWVQLFEPAMNFYFENDLAAGVFSIVNRQPKPGEQTRYDSRHDDPEHTVYGLAAYRPSLSGSGKVLILEGQSMAGTETAADFVFDDGYLLPFLRSIQRADGTVPYFELLLRSKSISGESSRLEVVATRVEER